MSSQRHKRGVRGLLAVLLLLPMLLAGCKFKNQVMAEIKQAVPAGFVESDWFVVAGSLSGMFTADGQVASLTCTYTVSGEVAGKPVTKTVTVKLEAKGNKGDKYELRCDDPLIAQFPSDATAFVATAKKGTVTTRLPVKSGLSTLAVAPGKHLNAAKGKQLVLIGMPASVKGTFMFRLGFKLARSRSIRVSPLFAGQVTCHHGATFYPPVVPLVTTISVVPSVLLPVAPVPVPVLLPLASVHSGRILVDCR